MMADLVDRLPYPTKLDDAASLAVETAFQKMGQVGAFDEHGLSESAQIFGKACALTALSQLCKAAIDKTMPSVATELTTLRARIADLEAQVASAADDERDRVVAWLPELADRSSAEFGPVIEGIRDFIANGAHRRPE